MTRRHPIRPTARTSRTTSRGRRLAAVASAAVLALTAACGGGGGGDDDQSSDDDSAAAEEARAQVEVSGAFDEKPEVTIEAPLEISESSSWTAEEGDGDEVGPSSTTILGLTIVNGQSGEVAISTYDEGQAPQEVDLTQQVFPSLVQGLVGQNAKSRVVIASTAEDAYGPDGSPQIGLDAGDPVVIVADVLSTDPADVLDAPEGQEEDVPRAAPQLQESDGVPSGFTVPRQDPPTKPRLYTLVEGEGPEITDPDRVTVNYLGQVWGGDEPFDDSYSRGEPTTFSIGLGRVIPAWDRLLQGVPEGSRVVLVCPPDLAYGAAGQGEDIPPNSTLVFVVDVLGVG
ncbi:FKBP-type peptidyl-prolyl cis-trans isomerase [Nocardioides marmoraquaticus]